MTHIESSEISINAENIRIYQFLGDFNNFEKLIPRQVTKWSSDANNCAFTLEGMADIEMKMGEKTDFSLIQYLSKEKTPFRFSINCNLTPLNNGSTLFKITLSADLNPFLKIMAERPLQNFVNTLAEKLKEVAEGGF